MVQFQRQIIIHNKTQNELQLWFENFKYIVGEKID